MDNENITKHSVTLLGNGNSSFSGVKKVDEFNSGRIILDTYKGTLEIDGNDLYIERYDTDRQVMEMTGEILGLKYSQTNNKKDKGTGLMARLFR